MKLEHLPTEIMDMILNHVNLTDYISLVLSTRDLTFRARTQTWDTYSESFQVYQIITHKYISPLLYFMDDERIQQLIHHQNIPTLYQLFLKSKLNSNQSIGFMELVIQLGENKVLESLLNHKNSYLWLLENHLISIACNYGHLDTLQILLKDQRVLIRKDILNIAIDGQFFDCVKLLLMDSRLMEYFSFNAIGKICEAGQLELIKLILSDSRLDSQIFNLSSIMIQSASKFGHIECVRLLLSDSRVDLQGGIVAAATNGYARIVELFLNDSRIFSSNAIDYAIRNASANGHADCVRVLLLDQRVNPGCFRNYCVKMAAKLGHVDVLKLLLCHPKVDPSADDCFALKLACERGHSECVEELMKSNQFATYIE
ncbi:hypothetical protein BC833DRAFT_580376 [Globomyces pollinis-pini]|nr:hypothetical protein BC833DRAFT_580376 [Globomyces pollinis-pini]